jgi:hypothetical protein
MECPQILRVWQTLCIDRVLIWGTLATFTSFWIRKTVAKSSQRAKNFWLRAISSICATLLSEKLWFAVPNTFSTDFSKNKALSRPPTFHTQSLTFSIVCLRLLSRFSSSTQVLLSSPRISVNFRMCLLSRVLRNSQHRHSSRLTRAARMS